MKKDARQASDPPRVAAGNDDGVKPDAPPADASKAPVERDVEPEEMGGEAPCQLHRFWDVVDE
jgi:hypothetical protein